MKIAIITDTHYGARKGSKHLHEYFEKFYNDIFFPELEKNNIDTIVHMGDIFDSRKSIDYYSLEWSKRVIFEPMKKYKVHAITGNHDCYYKNTNEINSPELLLQDYPNIITYSKAEEIVLDGLQILLLPWINVENYDESKKMIDESTSKFAMVHLEINGFKATRGHLMENGMDVKTFNKFEKVFSGHFHTRSNDGKIFYLGNPYEMFWNDVNDPRGFNLFDTKTLKHTPVNNPYRLFYNIYYEDTNYKLFDSRELRHKIVKVIVKRKTDQKQFEKFIDKLYNSGIQDLKIIENFVLTESADFEVEETENTIGILNRYIDESEFEGDKTLIKGILQQIYTEACEVD